jgi:hypothetical protein
LAGDALVSAGRNPRLMWNSRCCIAFRKQRYETRALCAHHKSLRKTGRLDRARYQVDPEISAAHPKFFSCSRVLW